ncbi:MAG: HEPN domain-containing protein [Anaerolineales bacterium]|nr:HEPN domain-containing protein [Anaerolineales bacterium]
MISEQAKALVHIRMEQARVTLEESRVLLREGYARGAVNRAYYAMFYAVHALAVIREVSTSKHTGMIGFFDRDFIKTDIFPRELSEMLHLAFDRRQSSDYGELAGEGEYEDAEETLANACTFVESIKAYLNNIAAS